MFCTERAASIVLKHLGSCPIWMKPSVTPGFDFEMFDVDIVYYLGSKEGQVVSSSDGTKELTLL